ncbi:MAG: hypothetical protein Q9195_006011 [Heterodermia aff. obscurata]
MTYAESRFRWAVCQLDALKRLKSERHIVMKALKNLPKTLDETYDRIFTVIPAEERLYVHFVLRWIAHHNELWNEDGMPCKVLIEAAGASTVMITEEPNERFYDQDTLREICGCLIEILPTSDKTLGFTSHSVTFAHYTVLEYLVSGRMSRGAAARHDAIEASSSEHFIEISMSEVQSVRSENLWSIKSEIDYGHVLKAIYSNFTSYSMGSGMLSLYRWPDKICRQSVLRKLAEDFLNPSRPHFKNTVAVASLMELRHVFPDLNFPSELMFWRIEWSSEVSTNAKHVYLLLLLCVSCKVYALLIKNFLQEDDHKHLLQSRIKYRRITSFSLSYRQVDVEENVLFDGTISEVFAQRLTMINHEDDISLLMEIGTGQFDLSVALLLSIGSHDPQNCYWKKCSTQKLLELGADPNLRGYIVTPLQIATYCMDFDGASLLLRYGAHPNSSGCSDTAAWKRDTVMGYLNHLHGASPLRILRKYTYIAEHDKAETSWIPEAREQLEELLLQYGAEEISATPNAALDEVEYDNPEWHEWATANPLTQAGPISEVEHYLPDHPSDSPNKTESSLQDVKISQTKPTGNLRVMSTNEALEIWDFGVWTSSLTTFVGQDHEDSNFTHF